MKLTLELIAAQENNTPTTSSLALPNKDLHEVSCLRDYVNLVRLDLSCNRIQSIQALSTCKSLKWLSVARNKLQSLCGIESLSNLKVLNAGNNEITSMKEVEGLVELRALIANDNQINSVCKLHNLTVLNTLVLSKNPILSIGTTIEKLSSLIKLSLSNCELQEMGSLKHLVGLKELRLAQNKIKHLSKDLSKNSQLQIIDLGSNYLKKLSDIEVLSTIPRLKNLNIRGNPLCLQNDYEAKVKTLLPNLQVLDGHLVKGSCKKRHSESVSPNTTKLNEEQKVEGHPTSKKSRQDEADKALTAGRDDDAQVSDDSHNVIKRREQLQKVENAVQDFKDGSLGDTSGTEKLNKGHAKKARKASHSVKSENDDSKPFIELINQKEPVTRELHREKKKDNSGLVSIIHNQAKVSKQKKQKQHAKTGFVLSLSMGDMEFGAGGPSSWD